MVVNGRDDSDVAPIQVEDDEAIEVVKHFTYLESTSSDNGDVMEYTRSRIAKASIRVFGCLRYCTPFLITPPSLSIKRVDYSATRTIPRAKHSY